MVTNAAISHQILVQFLILWCGNAAFFVVLAVLILIRTMR